MEAEAALTLIRPQPNRSSPGILPYSSRVGRTICRLFRKRRRTMPEFIDTLTGPNGPMIRLASGRLARECAESEGQDGFKWMVAHDGLRPSLRTPLP
jgi:hypothetical protein